MAIPPRSPLPMRAATYDSSKHSDPKATGSPRPDINPPSSYHANGSTDTTVRQRDSDLSHVGTWVAEGQRRSIASLAEVQPQALSMRPCPRHLAIREACSVGQSNLRIASLLKDPYSLAVFAQAGEEWASATGCTCKTAIEVDADGAMSDATRGGDRVGDRRDGSM